MAPTFRADQVGSFLRPAALVEAHSAYGVGKLPLQELRQLEDRAILEVLELQRQAGVDVLSDGEFRRGGWAGDFQDAVEGFVPGSAPISLTWRREEGDTTSAVPAVEGMNTAPLTRIIGGKLRQLRRMTEHETQFVKQHAHAPFKMTMPAPSYVVSRGYKPGVTDKVYESRAAVLKDASAIIQSEVKTLAAEGVPYIQLDNPHYPDYIPGDRRDQWRSIGIDPDVSIREDIEADNAALAGFDRSQVVLAMHLCRGNGGRAGFHTSGGYERIAEQVFGSLNVDRFLLEYDSDRAGGFEPLRFVPRGKIVVLGLVTTKSGTLESQDVLLKRIDEAAKYVPVQYLALSPQCGFASVMQGNPLTVDEERRKLDLVVDTARKVWG